MKREVGTGGITSTPVPKSRQQSGRHRLRARQRRQNAQSRRCAREIVWPGLSGVSDFVEPSKDRSRSTLGALIQSKLAGRAAETTPPVKKQNGGVVVETWPSLFISSLPFIGG